MADVEEMKTIILEFADKFKKSKFYFNDMSKAVQKVHPEVKAREVKKAANALVGEEKLILYSTGSTTMYGLKGRGQTEDQ